MSSHLEDTSKKKSWRSSTPRSGVSNANSDDAYDCATCRSCVFSRISRWSAPTESSICCAKRNKKSWKATSRPCALHPCIRAHPEVAHHQRRKTKNLPQMKIQRSYDTSNGWCAQIALCSLRFSLDPALVRRAGQQVRMRFRALHRVARRTKQLEVADMLRSASRPRNDVVNRQIRISKGVLQPLQWTSCSPYGYFWFFTVVVSYNLA